MALGLLQLRDGCVQAIAEVSSPLGASLTYLDWTIGGSPLCPVSMVMVRWAHLSYSKCTYQFSVSRPFL